MSLSQLLQQKVKLTVLTGAGISVGSGIPAYRDDAGQWQGSQPIQHQDFINDPMARQRYWARSMRGWPLIEAAKANPTHLALAALERAGRVGLLVTQNVDRLHQQAGHQHVVDLHGRLDKVVCLDCGEGFSRSMLQRRLVKQNAVLRSEEAFKGAPRPDGDADVSDAEVESFKVPGCEACGGVLKPDVVFFGGTVPTERVQRVREAVESSAALLVVGSSLSVFSGYRFCRYAQAAGRPIYIINRGSTRADAMATEKITEDCAAYLRRMVGALKVGGSTVGDLNNAQQV